MRIKEESKRSRYVCTTVCLFEIDYPRPAEYNAIHSTKLSYVTYRS